MKFVLSKRAIEETYDIVVGTLKDHSRESAQKEPFPSDCLGEAGYQYGSQAAENDLANHTVGAPGDEARKDQAFQHAYQACEIDNYIDKTVEGQLDPTLMLPESNNGFVAALEVALTPKPLNVGEAESLNARIQGQAAFESGVDQGYRVTAVKGFDDLLNDHLAIHWGEGHSNEPEKGRDM